MQHPIRIYADPPLTNPQRSSTEKRTLLQNPVQVASKVVAVVGMKASGMLPTLAFLTGRLQLPSLFILR